MLGFWKDLLPISDDVDATNKVPEHTIKRSSHGERVLVWSTKGRELLLKYSGFTRDRKRITRPKQLTTTEFRQLCQSLEEDGFNSLSALLKRLKRQTSKSLAPDEYRSFLAEVARCSPACGMIQISGDDQASAAILRVAQGTLNIFSSEHHQELLTVQRQLLFWRPSLPSVPRTNLVQYPKMCVTYCQTSLALFLLHFGSLSPQLQHTHHLMPHIPSSAISHIYISVMAQGATRQTSSDKQQMTTSAENTVMATPHSLQEFSHYIASMGCVMASKFSGVASLRGTHLSCLPLVLPPPLQWSCMTMHVSCTSMHSTGSHSDLKEHCSWPLPLAWTCGVLKWLQPRHVYRTQRLKFSS